MASIAESSLGSLQIAQLKEQILQGRVPPEANNSANVEATNSTSGKGGVATNNTDHGNGGSNVDGGVVIAESANACRTPISSPKTNARRVPPRLETAKSAPPSEMEAIVNPSPSQKAFDEWTRASSFPGPGFEGGDTQPLESQFVEEYMESMHQAKAANTTTPKKEKTLLQISPDGKVEFTYETSATGRTPRTCQEGDPGYVDLADWQPDAQSPAAGSDSDMEDLLNNESPEEQAPTKEDVFRKPAVPETPSLAGHKRRRSGELLTSDTPAAKTPGFTQAFGFAQQKGDMLSGTQLFEQTQARSSPMPVAPLSDPALTRPSPNINHDLAVSSPTVMMSSPIHTRAPPGTAGEPREKYTSLQESQDRKRAKMEGDYNLRRPTGEAFDDCEDDDEDPIVKRYSNQRLRRTVSEDAVQTLKKVRVPSRPSSRPTTSSSPHKATLIDLRTPATMKRAKGFVFAVSDDGESDDERMQEDELVVEDRVEDAADDVQQSENDVYDELGQTVLRSQGPEPDEEDEAEEDAQEDEIDDAIPDPTGQEPEQVAPERTLVQGSSQQDRIHLQRASQTATQHSAIADSQPLRNQRQQGSVSQQGNNGSPSCSYVPGSQYAGKTSQDQASLIATRTGASMGPHTLSSVNKSQDAVQQVVPSSPPLAKAHGTSVEHIAGASLERRRMLDQFQAGGQDTERPAEQEIPESDLPVADNMSPSPATAEDRPNTESNNAPFSTARSHLSTNGTSLSQGALAPSPLKAFASQQSKVNSQSPRSKAGVRRFADIAGGPAPPTGSGEVLAEVDDVMNGIMTAEDQHFLNATSSPPRERAPKRRRMVGKPSIRSSSPVKEVHANILQQPDVQAEHSDSQNPVIFAEAKTALETESEELETRALRNSPSKANEQRAAFPPPESTPESVKLREQAGAKAASQLLSKRSARLSKPKKAPSTGRKAVSKLQNEWPVTEDKITSKKKTKTKRAVVDIGEADDVDAAGTVAPVEVANEPEIEETVLETNEIEQNEEHPDAESHGIAAPHRVFALFKGTYNMFYPSTWLGTTNGGQHRIRFDDGTITSIEPHLVARMELALGDQVKIDFEGMKNKVWVVKGFGPALPSNKAPQALTDIYGHETVKVQAKSARSSGSGPNAVAQGYGETFNVAVEVVYLSFSLWSNVSRREFQPGPGTKAATRLETPSTGVQTPLDAETPLSRSRRAKTSTVKATEKRGSFLRDESATALKTPSAGLFHGMAFAVSYVQNENEKVNVTSLIQRNGGIILDDGFEGLFTAPKLDEDEATGPSKKSAKKDATDFDEEIALRLKTEHNDLGFVALIADKHSRRAKYIQALALGIPAISGRWITDSVDAAKNASLSDGNAAPLSWTKYLLAAGESSYLNGAIRSREITTCDAASTKLDNTIANRPLLLSGEGVLIVASKKNKAVWERRKAFAFLTLALGAGHVRRVSDLQEAKALTANEPEKWRFIYIDGSVADASTVVFGKCGAGAAGNKKRKRDGPPAPKVDAKAMSASDGSVRIVNDEFVVQSLILGALVD